MQPDRGSTAGAQTIQRTLERLRQAREACRTADLARLLDALEMLGSACAEFEAWCRQVRGEPAKLTLALGSELARVKREAASLLRLVDACAAVQRGLAVRSGAMTVAYSPSGAAPIPASVFSAYDMQV